MKKLSDDEMEEVLQHFGTKGMRWGVRRAASAAVGAAGQLKTLRRSKMNSAAKTVVDAASQLKTLRRSKMNSTAKTVVNAAGHLKTLRRSKMNSAANSIASKGHEFIANQKTRTANRMAYEAKSLDKIASDLKNKSDTKASKGKTRAAIGYAKESKRWENEAARWQKVSDKKQNQANKHMTISKKLKNNNKKAVKIIANSRTSKQKQRDMIDKWSETLEFKAGTKGYGKLLKKANSEFAAAGMKQTKSDKEVGTATLKTNQAALRIRKFMGMRMP